MRRLLFLWVLLMGFAFADEQKVIIDVKGMHCPMCVSAINQALRNTEGVVYAKSFLPTEHAEVIVPEGFDLNKLLTAIEETGYTGTVRETTKIPKSR